MTIRYAVAACQTDLPNPTDRRQMSANTDRMLSMIDSAVAGSAPFLPVRLIVFPEFAHAAPVFPTLPELLDRLAVPIPNEHTDRLERKAREYGIYIQSGSMLEVDSRWPDVVFNTSCLIGPAGILSRSIARSTRGSRTKCMRARTTSPDMTSRSSRSLTHQSVDWVAQFVMTGYFPKQSGSSRRTAQKSSSGCRRIWTRGARPSR